MVINTKGTSREVVDHRHQILARGIHSTNEEVVGKKKIRVVAWGQ